MKKLQALLTQMGPDLLIGLGIGGFVASVFMSASASKEVPDKASFKEKVKAYAPTAIVCAASGACVLTGSYLKSKKYAALATMLSITEESARAYQEKVIESIGPKKERVIRESVLDEKIKNDGRALEFVQSNVANASSSDVLCYDAMSDRYFYSTADKIQRAINNLNQRMISGEDYVSLNELYDELNLPHTTLGNMLGWNVSKYLIELDDDCHLAPNNTPCYVINFSRLRPPLHDFWKN